MKAQAINGYGDVDQFELRDVPTPDVGLGEVLVRVRAIGLNPMEFKIRHGWLRDMMPTTFPAILGNEVAGVIDQVGEDVSDHAIGDRVVGFTSSGAYAEYAVARTNALAPVPASLTFSEAVTIPTAAETSQRVIEILKPQASETFVVNGAAGAVGSAAVQLLVWAGVRVIGTASYENHDYLRRLGATPVTYGDGVVERIRAIAPGGIDAVFDVTGHGFIDAAIALRNGTKRIVTIADFDVASTRGVTASMGDGTSITNADFISVLGLAAAGEFATEIARTFSFTDIAAAHSYSEAAHLRGKIIVTGPDQ